MGDMVWKKLSREGGFIIPESMLDVRDYCSNHNLKPSPEMGLEKMKKIVQDDFGGHIGIWGSIERAPGEEAEIYDLAIKCVDFSAQPSPKVLYEVKARTNATGEIPHVYVKQMLDALYGRKPGGPAATDSIAEDNWKNRPNLVVGDFEHGSGGVPKGWDKVCGQKREPLGRLVRWVAEEGNPGNRVIRFTLDKAVAEDEGVMYYSDYFPVEEGAKYRFQCRWRSKGPAVKVFIKCYDEMGSQYRAESEKPGKAAAGKRRLGKDDYIPEYAQRREVYRSQQPLSDGPVNTWTWSDAHRGLHAETHQVHAQLGPRHVVRVHGAGRGRVRRRGGQADRARRDQHGTQSAPPFDRHQDHHQRDGGERSPQQRLKLKAKQSQQRRRAEDRAKDELRARGE